MKDTRVRTIVILLVGLGFGVLTLVLASSAPAYSFTGLAVAGDVTLVRVSVPRAALELAAGWSVLVVGAVELGRRRGARFGVLLVAVCFGWFLTDWNNPGTGSALAFTVGLALSAAAPPLVAHAGLAERTGRLDGAVLLVAYLGAFVLLGLAPALLYDPVANGCDTCPRNLLLVHDSAGLSSWLSRMGVRAGLGWSLALIVLLALQLLRATPARRRVVWPVTIAAAAFLGFVAWDFAHSLDRGTLGVDATDRRLWIGEAAAVIAIALAVVWRWVRVRTRRAAVARLVVDLVESSPAGGLRVALAQTLGDPSLQLAYELSDGRLVDSDGHVTTLEGEVTPLMRGRRQLALLAHRPGLLVDPELVDEVVAVARLTLENERLHAEAQARLEDLRASRARVVATGDAERRRLERDLHDGAQQGLVALSLALAHARSHADPVRQARLAEAGDALGAALEDLRRLAHGIFPAVLADEGLAAALETLADETDVALDISSLPADRLDPRTEGAAYYTVAEIVRQGRPRHLQIDAARENGRLILDVESDGAISDVTSLEDRLGALDGRLTVGPGGRIHAEIPCEW